MISAAGRSGNEWLDAGCWACGSTQVAPATGDARLCGPCREELLEEPTIDVPALARYAYWESHPLRCCWRCMTRAVEQRDEVGLCGSCREELGLLVREGAA